MPTYCTLADAYGDEWGKPKQKKTKQPQKPQTQPQPQPQTQTQPQPQTQPQTQPQVLSTDAPQGAPVSAASCTPFGYALQSDVPSCHQCLRQNNEFQQRVIDQAIRPLPRWYPQTSETQAWDPFNRYFGSGYEGFGNEGFSSVSGTKTDIGNLIQLVFYLLVTLFIIQLLELISSLY